MNELTQIKDAQELVTVVMGGNVELIAKAISLEVETADDLKIATEIGCELKERIKAGEDKRTSITQPINAGLKEINKSFKDVSEPLEDAISAIKKKMLPVQQRINRELAEAAEGVRKQREADLLAAAERKADVGQDKKADDLVEKAIALKPKVDNSDVGRGGFSGAKSTVTKRWTYEVVDIVAFAKAHPELVEVQKGGVRKLIAGGTQVEGLKVFQEESIGIR